MLPGTLILTRLFRHTMTADTVIVTTAVAIVATAAVTTTMILAVATAAMILEVATAVQIPVAGATRLLAVAETNPHNNQTPSDCYDLFIAITFFIKSSSLFVHPARNTC